MPITAFSNFTDGLDASQRNRGHFVANIDIDDQRRWVPYAEGVWIQPFVALALYTVATAGPYREINISDIEVREIEGVVATVAPGATISIGGVSARCICEDGPQCTNNVDTTEWIGTTHKIITLSRIDGKWTLGPLMRWRLEADKLSDKYFEAYGTAETPEQWDHVWSFYHAMLDHRVTRPKCTLPNYRMERPRER